MVNLLYTLPSAVCARVFAIFLFSAVPILAQYSARRIVIDEVEVIRLEDRAHHTIVSIAPSIGNIAYQMLVNGKNALYFPFDSVGAFQKKPRLCGIPLLAPWADRLDEMGFYANGKRYAFQAALGNVRMDGTGHPIHGFLTFAKDWKVLKLEFNARHALVSSVLDVSRRPDWMAQFPFAHTIQITHTLQDGVLQVTTRVTNQSAEAMPMSMGFHSFYQVTDAPRADWLISLGAATEWPVDKEMIPTGVTRPLTELIPTPAQFRLGEQAFDNVLADLIPDAKGRATFSVTGKQQKVEVFHGPKFIAGEIWAPPKQPFVCFEPMAGIDDAINLAHKGVYKQLQTIAPGEVWEESFWIKPSGF